MIFIKFPKIVFGILSLWMVVNVDCADTQWGVPNNCRVETIGSQIVDATNRISEKCNVSFSMILQPIPTTGQINIEMELNFAGILSSNDSGIRISLFYHETDCSNVDDIRRLEPPFRVNPFGIDKGPQYIYKKGLSCTTVENLLPGKYCPIISVYDKLHNWCADYRYPMITLSERIIPAPIQPPTDYVPLYIGIGVVMALLGLGIFGLFLIRCYYPDGIVMRTGQKVFQALLPDSPVPVLLVYYPDCPHHVQVVEQLANFLNSNNCIVSYDAIEMDLIARNKVGWLDQKLRGSHKILIVNSLRAFREQQNWLETKNSNPDGNGSSTFIMALASIRHNTQLAYDYNKVFMLRPSYVPCQQLLSDIVPSRHYDLPGDLDVLLRHLHRPSSIGVDVETPDVRNNCTPAHANLCEAIERLQPKSSDVDCASGGSTTNNAACRLCSGVSGDRAEVRRAISSDALISEMVVC